MADADAACWRLATKMVDLTKIRVRALLAAALANERDGRHACRERCSVEGINAMTVDIWTDGSKVEEAKDEFSRFFDIRK